MALINSEVKKFIQNLREHFKEKKDNHEYHCFVDV